MIKQFALSRFTRKSVLPAALATLAATLAPVASAATVTTASTDTTFTPFLNLVLGYATGPLGKGLAIAAMIIGAFTGVAKSSAVPVMIGAVFAFALGLGPGIIESIFTAVI